MVLMSGWIAADTLDRGREWREVREGRLNGARGSRCRRRIAAARAPLGDGPALLLERYFAPST